jgi:VanZ family protein
MDSNLLSRLNAGRLWQLLLAAYWLAMLAGTHTPPRFHAVREELSDKLVHFAAYAGLAWLLAMAWQTSVGQLNRRHLRWAWLAIMLYAVLDEVTQPPFGRDASVWDLLADALGSATGLFVFTLTRHWFDRTELVEPSEE